MATATSAPPVTAIEQRGYAHPEMLVSTDWVEQHLKDPKVRLVESNGQHWADVIVYGHKMRRHGPYSSADEAKGMAIQFAAVCRVFHQPMEVCRG